jgi:hypothetical protein
MEDVCLVLSLSTEEVKEAGVSRTRIVMILYHRAQAFKV